MEYARVTINYGNVRQTELKLSLEITAGELIRKLSDIYGAESAKVTAIQAEPLGRILDNTKKLSQEGIATGSLLTFI